MNQNQIELIHREIDGANTPAESAAFRSLIAENPEAKALAAELRGVTALLERTELREPPARLKQTVLDALRQPARASPQSIIRWSVFQLKLVTGQMEAIMTRKALLIGSAAVAVVLVSAALITGFPPMGREAGTIGGGDIPGVQQAARYHGRVMTQADVTLKNPEIQTLFQNDKILGLVRSDAFRQVMSNAAYHELMSSEAYHELMSSEAYHELMSSEAYHELMASEAYHELMASEAFRHLQATGAFRQAQSAEAMRTLQSNELFLRLQENELFRKLQSNEAFLRLQSNELFLRLQDNELFLRLQENELFRELQSNEAFRQLEENELFRNLSRSEQLSAAFINEAMRFQQ